jgi:hypothetical protein
MSIFPPEKRKARSPLARLHSPAVMLLLVFMLVVYLVYVLAESFGLEGEGGWLGEVLGAFFFVGGIIFAAVLVGGLFLGVKTLIVRRRGGSLWMDDDETP